MNSKQLATVKHLTSRLSQLVDNMSFEVTVLDKIKSKPVMISASNIGCPWYVAHEFFLAFIGPRGGLEVREGSSHLRKMI
jgi:hypothetical protein